jgi:hypothetical protein
LDLEALTDDDDHSSGGEEEDSDGAYPYFLVLFILILIGNFIDDDTLACGSGGTQHTSWNTLQNGEDLDDFFHRLYERYRSHRMRPTAEHITNPHDCIIALPGADEFPLWRIGCRVRL